MRIAISNIAWEVTEDVAIAALLERHGIDAIDIAPGKYFPHFSQATIGDFTRVRDWWGQRGVELTGMQSLLFGTSGLNIFGTEASRRATLDHLDAVCRVGGGLGARRLVFGSPKNRDRTGLDDEAALAIAVPFFRELGDLADSHGVIVCLEPNPPVYGSNFMTNSIDTAAIVEAIGHPAIRMQLDIGAITIEGEDVVDVLARCAALIGHVHASEPGLVPVGDSTSDHARAAAAVAKYLPAHLVCVEMIATKDEAHASSIERALVCATRHYRPDPGPAHL